MFENDNIKLETHTHTHRHVYTYTPTKKKKERATCKFKTTQPNTQKIPKTHIHTEEK